MSLQRIIWLASFPKSGNTWMRYLLAHYFMPKGQAPDINNIRQFTTADVRQDFFDRAAGKPYQVQSLDEWLAVRTKAIRMIAASRDGHHFVKTHCQVRRAGEVDIIPPEVTAAAIYVIRNPFDIAPSFARHLGIDVDGAIDKMMDETSINATPTGIFEILGRWDHHAISWTESPGLQRHILRYEDMHADPEKAVRALLGFLKAPINDGTMRRAIRAASFKNMSKQEAEKGFRERPPGMKQFFHSGTAGGWRDVLRPHQVARIRTAFLPTLIQFYPELVDETAEIAGR